MLLRRRLTQTAITALVFVSMWGLSRAFFAASPEASSGKAIATKPLLVEVLPVLAQPFSIQIDSFGTVQAGIRSDVYPLVSGQIVKVSPQFKSGLAFKKGDILLEIDATDYQLALQQQRSELAQAEVALAEELARSDQARRDWETQQRQAQKRSEPISDYALRKPQLILARTNLDTAIEMLAVAQLNLERTRVRAPYDGFVISTFVDVGEVASPSIRIAEIYDAHSLEVRLPVASKDLAFIELPQQASSKRLEQKGAEVELVSTLAGQTTLWQGRLVRSDVVIDSATQQVFMIAEVDAHSDAHFPLKLGQYLKAQIQGRTLEGALVVPNNAVYQGAHVYVVRNDRVYKEDIQIRWRNKQFSVIERGLQAGDQLVTTLLGQVTSGTAVAITGEDALARAGSDAETVGVKP